MITPNQPPEHVEEAILTARLIAILRGFTSYEAQKAMAALAAGGVRILEVSLVDPDALKTIRLLRSNNSVSEFVIGAGTVLTSVQATSAIEAGADFLFSPGLNATILAMARKHGILAIPGVLTPSEITVACELDVPLVKLFPAEPLGPPLSSTVERSIP
jgi:2-dehydro-3-deoxyphosphogluconate aldolase / (4S)-4-hydroxy-2-oxoglutarate aldolase